jgi:hypothetical protein
MLITYRDRRSGSCRGRGRPRNRQEMRVIAGELGIHAEAARDLATRLHPIFVTGIASVSHDGENTNLIYIGTSRGALETSTSPDFTRDERSGPEDGHRSKGRVLVD